MTKIIVQLYVENLLKVLKVLKTRTALTRNRLSELRIRYARKGAKAPFKPKKQLTNDQKMISYKLESEGTAMVIKSYITDTDGNEKLSKYFKVKEFACKDGSPVVFIDEHLYTVLDILRNKLGKPVIITSGYRTPEWNKKCNGAKYSYHMRGMAADIRVNGMSAKEIANELNKIVPDECGIIVYKSWVHFDVRTNKYRKGV